MNRYSPRVFVAGPTSITIRTTRPATLAHTIRSPR